MAVPGTPVDRAPDSGVVLPVREREVTGRAATRASVVAVVIGAVSLFIGVLGPVAIVAGLRARRRGESWLALLAIIAGSVSTAFLLLGIVHYLLAALA
jgi:hypothetical protein